MLAQNFKSAADLGISDAHEDALIKTLVLLETGKLRHVFESPLNLTDIGEEFTGHFNMARWNSKNDCGTVCCIGGTAELIGNVLFDNFTDDLEELFYPPIKGRYEDVTTEQAARALRSYLTTGEARWDLAVA